MRILGIDPGFGRTGWGVIEIASGAPGSRSQYAGQAPKYVASGCIKTSSKENFQDRILKIASTLEKVCKIYKPDAAALEKLFFSKNVRTAMQVGEARGVVLLTIARAGIMLKELSPNEVKQAVTGYGHADKTQIGHMVKMLLKLKGIPKPDDRADALAIAIAASAYIRLMQK